MIANGIVLLLQMVPAVFFVIYVFNVSYTVYYSVCIQQVLGITFGYMYIAALCVCFCNTAVTVHVRCINCLCLGAYVRMYGTCADHLNNQFRCDKYKSGFICSVVFPHHIVASLLIMIISFYR